MQPFIVSARKYRPAVFDTVVGQSTITDTLKNAIRTGHLAQAFLFCGPRGVGKTTCARILARTINCESLGDDLTACGQCAPCMTFAEGHSLNIYELDAASNNSVDDIRNLITQVQIAPQVGSRKVYIIDEVHMLSQAAFNAFLKTLEEPPSYAIFILATTEKHKILPTILSRCQVFDFRRIQLAEIVAHLRYIAEKEGVEAETLALHTIAQKADGSLRDALSIFDQLVSFAGSTLTYQDVARDLNVLDHEHFFSITSSILQADVPGCLVEYDQIVQNGFDGHLFITGLSKHMRDLLLARDERTTALLEVSEDLLDRYVEQAAKATSIELFTFLDVMSQADVHYKNSKEPRLLVELALIKCCRSMVGPINEDVDPAKNIRPAAVATPLPRTQVTAKNDGSKVPGTDKSEAVAPAPTDKPGATGNSVSPGTTTFERSELKATAGPAVKRKKRKGAVSITDFTGDLVEKERTPKIQPPVTKAAESSAAYETGDPAAVTQEALYNCWKQYALLKKNEGMNSFHATLMYKEPQLENGRTIRFSIVNEVQEKDLRDERGALLDHLRSKLNAPGLELLIEKDEVGELKPRYTSMDRFKIMAENNPSLVKLKDQLDLDLS